MTRWWWIVLAAACASKDSGNPPAASAAIGSGGSSLQAAAPEEPRPRDAAIAEGGSVDAAGAAAAPTLDDFFHALDATVDGTQVLIANLHAFERPLTFRTIDVATGAVAAEVVLVERAKLPHSMSASAADNERALAAALRGNQALVDELRRAAQLISRFPSRNQHAVLTSADTRIVLAQFWTRWLLVAGDEVSVLPESFVDPWIAPDGTILHRATDPKQVLGRWTGLWKLSPATRTSTRLAAEPELYASGYWTATPAGTVRMPAGGGDTPLCVYELVLPRGTLKKKLCLAGPVDGAPLIRLSRDGAWFAALTARQERGTPQQRLRLVEVATGKVRVDTTKLALGELDYDAALEVDDTGVAIAASSCGSSVPAGPIATSSNCFTFAGGSALTSQLRPPRARTTSTSPAAGYTSPDVPTARNRKWAPARPTNASIRCIASRGIGSPNHTMSGRSSASRPARLHGPHIGATPARYAVRSSNGARSHTLHRDRIRLPWSSITRSLPAATCSPSMFWVTSRNRSPSRRSASTSARCPAFGSTPVMFARRSE